MTHAQLTDQVRQIVIAAFASLGVAHPQECRESILIHDGNYCGRRFETEGAHAVWFVEENQIKVTSGDGRSQVLSAPLGQTLLPARKAA